MPILNLVWCLALFLGLVFGLGLPLAASLSLRADEKLCAGAALALGLIYLFAFTVYWLLLPSVAFWLLPLAAVIALVLRRRACLNVLRDSRAQSLLGAYLIATGWCLGFLALIRTYSGMGGGVVGDWIEHYQRTQFFLFHWPKDFRFIHLYSLPARPPLANLVTGAFLALTNCNYAHYQVFTTLASSLVFLPALLFVFWMTSSERAAGLFLFLFMVNPFVLHNSTYPWTKLVTAFFVLTGVFFFVRSREEDRGGLAVGAFACLAAALLAHYSAAPYLLGLTASWFWWRRREWRTRRWGMETAACALAGGLLLSTWLAWAIAVYGVKATFLSNTAVTYMQAPTLPAALLEKGANVFNTVIPHPFRHLFDRYLVPDSLLFFVRDYAFVLYQLNLPMALGSAGGVLTCWLLWRQWRQAALSAVGLPRTFWVFFVLLVVATGISVNGGPDRLGLAHICLQPLIILGLAFLAARVRETSRLLLGVLLARSIVDFSLGIALHFYAEHLDFPASLWAQDQGATLSKTYDHSLAFSVFGKNLMHYAFLGDGPISPRLVLALLACLAALALIRLQRSLRNIPAA